MNKEYSAIGSAVTSGASTAEAPVHSPLPWRTLLPNGRTVIAEDGVICDMFTRSHAENQENERANAAFIVRACNSHYQLIVQLEKLLSIHAAQCGVSVSDLKEEPKFVAIFAAITAAKEQQ